MERESESYDEVPDERVELAKQLGRDMIKDFGSIERAYAQAMIILLDLGATASQVSHGYVRMRPKDD